MKKAISLAIIFMTLTFSVAPAFSDEASNEAQARYEKEKKEPIVAVLLCTILCVPPYSWIDLGHAYAGNWTRSLIFDAFDCLGILLLLTGIGGGDSVEPTEALGGAIFFGSMIWRIVDAGITANDTNRELQKKHGLALGIRNDVPVLQYSCEF